MSVLAFIPARSGSKGLPDKNIRLLKGIPLLGWSVLAARDSGICDEIFVSTDSEAYAAVARSAGGSVPFLRPSHLAGDTTSTYDAVWDALDRYQKQGRIFDTLLLLQPTSPLRTALDIQQAYALFCERNATSVVSVCEVEHSPLWCNTLPPSLGLQDFLRPETKGKIRQELPTYYRLNGAIYIADIEALRNTGAHYLPGSYAYVMPAERSVDIDTQLDFKIAEAILG